MPPKVRHHLSRAIDAAGGNDVSGERLPRDHFSAGGIGGARRIAEPAAGGQRIVDRNDGARAVANIGEVAGALGLGGDGIYIRLALAQLESFIAEKEEGFVFLNRSGDRAAVLILLERGPRHASLV